MTDPQTPATEALPPIVTERATDGGLNVDDLDSILLALRSYPTWFDRTVEKVEAIRAALSAAEPVVLDIDEHQCDEVCIAHAKAVRRVRNYGGEG